jgi:hypothetical protein
VYKTPIHSAAVCAALCNTAMLRARYLRGEKIMRRLPMRHLHLAIGMVALAVYMGPVRADAEHEIDQIEERRYHAMVAADTQALAQILAEEFVYTSRAAASRPRPASSNSSVVAKSGSRPTSATTSRFTSMATARPRWARRAWTSRSTGNPAISILPI